MSFVEGLSESGLDIRTVAVCLAFAMALAFVRLLSERPLRAFRKEADMKQSRQNATNKNSSNPRSYWQYLLETIWTASAGVLATSLSTLSERWKGAPRGALRIS